MRPFDESEIMEEELGEVEFEEHSDIYDYIQL